MALCWPGTWASLYYVRKGWKLIFSEDAVVLPILIVVPRTLMLLHSYTLRMLSYVCADFGERFREDCFRNPLANPALVHYLEHHYFHDVGGWPEGMPGAAQEEDAEPEAHLFSCNFSTCYTLLVMTVVIVAVRTLDAYFALDTTVPYWRTYTLAALLSTEVFLRLVMKIALPELSRRELCCCHVEGLPMIQQAESELRPQLIHQLRRESHRLVWESIIYAVCMLWLGVGMQWLMSSLSGYAPGDEEAHDTRVFSEGVAGLLYIPLAFTMMVVIDGSGTVIADACEARRQARAARLREGFFAPELP